MTLQYHVISAGYYQLNMYVVLALVLFFCFFIFLFSFLGFKYQLDY